MIIAVAAVLVCGEEVFVIRRQPHLRAFPGYHAFPGGKIDAGDDIRLLEHALVDRFPAAHMTALYRELGEELQFDLAGALHAGVVSEMELFGTAITPRFEKIRFCASYYKIVLHRKPVFCLDRSEIFEAGWSPPRRWCDQYFRGQALMVVPMRHTLLKLAQDMASTECEPFNIDIPEGELACIELVDGLRTIPVPSNTLPPAHTTNALLLGDAGQPQVLVDPSPESEQVYAKLLKTLVRHPADAVFLSHHHPDHHERAIELAQQKQLPVLLSDITRMHLLREYGADYLAHVELQMVAEGSEITRWKAQPVRAYALPGHDDGMLGLAPDSLDWFFVADLVQSQGSVVIPDQGGDLDAYLASLQRVIELNPGVILPSHGIPTGGTVILERAREHRLAREQQIRPLFEAGASTGQILEAVYPGLDEALVNLARQTIHQHLRKLRADAARP